MTIGTNYASATYIDPALYAQQKTAATLMANQSNSVLQTQQVDSFSSSSASGETCTDGKDDGKIGFFGAIGNAIKGVGKAVVNGVKGMFTNKEGKFSLGKTLLSVGTMALCVAFPAVGVAACAIGGVMAAGQVVKGAVNASKATTDAEAKLAWQDIGGGTFGVAMSVVGAKAGMKAVGKTSTATNGLASLKGTKATFGQKVKAFGNDMVSSTKNSYANVKNIATTKLGDVKQKAFDKKVDQVGDKYLELSELEAAQAKAKGIDPAAATPDELSLLKEAEIRETFANQSEFSKMKSQAKVSVADAKRNFTSKYGDVSSKLKTTAADLKAKAPTLAEAKAKAASLLDDSQSGKILSSAKDQLKAAEGLKAKWQLVTSKLNKNTLATIKNSLSADGNAILTKLNNNANINELIAQYGYENVQQVIALVAGTKLA